MYLPDAFKVSDTAVAFEFIERYDFATLITPARKSLQVTHLPLLLKRSEERAFLAGHMARPNPHWKHFDGSAPSLAIFHGPHGYVSPNWYANQPSVPTWNYAVVHVYGCPRAIEDRDATVAILNELVRKNEDHRPNPWNTKQLPSDYFEKMASGIVAFETPIDRIESKFKLGQNRSNEDREGAMRGLLDENSAAAHALAAFMREYGSQ